MSEQARGYLPVARGQASRGQGNADLLDRALFQDGLSVPQQPLHLHLGHAQLLCDQDHALLRRKQGALDVGNPGIAGSQQGTAVLVLLGCALVLDTSAAVLGLQRLYQAIALAQQAAIRLGLPHQLGDARVDAGHLAADAGQPHGQPHVDVVEGLPRLCHLLGHSRPVVVDGPDAGDAQLPAQRRKQGLQPVVDGRLDAGNVGERLCTRLHDLRQLLALLLHLGLQVQALVLDGRGPAQRIRLL